MAIIASITPNSGPRGGVVQFNVADPQSSPSYLYQLQVLNYFTMLWEVKQSGGPMPPGGFVWNVETNAGNIYFQDGQQIYRIQAIELGTVIETSQTLIYSESAPPPEALVLNSITPNSGTLPSVVSFASTVQNYVANFPIRRYFLQYFNPATGQFEDLQSSVVNSANLSDSTNIPAVPGGSVRLRTRVSSPDIVSNELVYTIVVPPPPPVLTPCQPGQNAGEWAKSPADLGFSENLPDELAYGNEMSLLPAVKNNLQTTPDYLYLYFTGPGNGLQSFVVVDANNNPAMRKISRIRQTLVTLGGNAQLELFASENEPLPAPQGAKISGTVAGNVAISATPPPAGRYLNARVSPSGSVWQSWIEVEFL